MRDAHEFVAIFLGALARFAGSRAVVERQVGDVMLALELLEHLVGANLSALVHGMKQFGFEPEYAHSGSSQNRFGG